jgi:hypothetical protein
MTPVRRIALIGAFWLACIPGSIAGAKEPAGTAGGPSPLKMEELEVRGLLEKPDRLYLPASRRPMSPLPTRFDLFLEDLTRPVLPWEITNDRLPNGGARESGDAVD